MTRYYISTAIHYVNDLPHIGHIYENIVADTVARFHRMKGEDVFFLTGTDEHGQKIQRSAEKEGVKPIELADRVVLNHHENWKKLGISHNDFIRTTEPRHHKAVYELIRRIRVRNPDDIYIGEHTGWYCSNEEAFFPDSQVQDGKCENGHPVETTSEKNYFFRLSRYQEPLLEIYRSNPSFIQPKSRYNEVVSFVEQGLKDLSVSRTSIDWGIPWPDDPEHVIYVWMDALTNYITALGFGSDDTSRFDQYWPADAHLIGKDIVRFHAVFWPAFLLSAGIELPKSIVAHGWWLRDNQKISKSTGHIVRPDHIIDGFGPDPLRFYLLREMVFGQDANYSDEGFLTRYNADLANDVGNTLSRILKMSHSWFDGKTPPVTCDDNDIKRTAEAVVPEYLENMEAWAFQKALDAVWRLLNEINGYIVAKEPWKLQKDAAQSEALSRVIWNTLEGMRLVWQMLAPVMPHLATDALRRLGAGDDPVTTDSLVWGRLKTGVPVEKGDSMFPRVDAKKWLEAESSTETKDAEGTPTNEDASEDEDGKISVEKFFETDLRVAEVIAAEKVEKSKKLMRLRITLGDEERTLVAGIAAEYTPEDLVGRKIVVVANLQPAKLMGIESNGMVLAASIDGKPSLLSVDSNVPAGTKVR